MAGPLIALPSILRRRLGNGPSSLAPVNLTATVGSVSFRNPVLTAAGTAGYGAELASYFPLDTIGAVVVKSLSADAWSGNPAPRVTQTSAGMLNSVGLQNSGVQHWIEHDLPKLRAANATIVASIWGFTIDDYERAATALRDVDGIAAIEVNVSCPNIEDRRHMFAHSESGTASVIAAARRGLGADRPIWAKLSPNVTALTDIAQAAVEAGADALTLINTVMGMVIDIEQRKLALGAGGGGLSGPAIRPVAVRAIYETRKVLPDIPIVGAGGVARGVDAVELFMAGANAVEVGTATFYEPAAPARVLAELEAWCRSHNILELRELIGAAHG